VGLGELFRASLESIRAHKLRSFLTLLGIIIGVTTVVAVASVAFRHWLEWRAATAISEEASA
jgi:hypothetical protein